MLSKLTGVTRRVRRGTAKEIREEFGRRLRARGLSDEPPEILRLKGPNIFGTHWAIDIERANDALKAIALDVMETYELLDG